MKVTRTRASVAAGLAVVVAVLAGVLVASAGSGGSKAASPTTTSVRPTTSVSPTTTASSTTAPAPATTARPVAAKTTAPDAAIAYATPEEIGLMGPEGQRPHRLVGARDLTGEVEQATIQLQGWTGDGRLLATQVNWRTTAQGNEPAHSDVVVIDRTGHTVLRAPGTLATFSPDGQRLAVQSTEQNTIALHRLAEPNAAPTFLDKGAVQLGQFGFGLAWSPDGARIAFFGTEAGGNRGLYTAAVAGGSTRYVLGVSNFNGGGPRWGPDNRLLVAPFAGESAGLVTVADDADPRPATLASAGYPVHFQSPDWSLDGRSVTYATVEQYPCGVLSPSSCVPPNTQVKIQAARPGAPARSLGPAGCGTAQWTASGRLLLTCTDGAVRLIRVDGSGLQKIGTYPQVLAAPRDP